MPADDRLGGMICDAGNPAEERLPRPRLVE